MKRERKKRTLGAEDCSFKALLLPNKEQIDQIAKTLGSCRYVYNRALDQRNVKYKESKETISYIEQQNELQILKKEENTKWLAEVDATALQNSLRDLQNAYDNFFKALKENRYVGFPKFKSKHDNTQSYRMTNNNNSINVIDDAHIQLPKLGKVKCKLTKKIQGRILHATITRTSDNKYEISIMYEMFIEPTVQNNGAAIGVDLGVKSLAITSDGETFDNPKSYHKNLKKLRRLQRKLSRKPKGSKNREKARIRVAKLHRRIKNQRLDASHKMTRQLVNKYDVICIEHLNVSKMKNHSHLSQAISDASFGEVRRQLEYKCRWAGKQLILVDQWFPSSQLCSHCGYQNIDVKNLSIRLWKCPVCGEEHDRDYNAAINILKEGLKQLA